MRKGLFFVPYTEGVGKHAERTPLGVLLGYICFRFFRDRGNTISSHSLSVYEEVKPKQESTAMDMNDNEAYAIPQ